MKKAQKIALILTVFTLLFIAGCVQQPMEPNKRTFAGKTITFRANLDEAAKVPIYPNETAMLRTLYDPAVNWIYIAYVPNDDENGFYAVTGYELTFKLAGAYKAMFGRMPAVRELELNATPEQPASDALVIWMRGPAAGANQTDVTINGGIITVEGADVSEVNTYTDLDLAADRLLLSFMWPPQE
jgi:hypothetical protein